MNNQEQKTFKNYQNLLKQKNNSINNNSLLLSYQKKINLIIKNKYKKRQKHLKNYYQKNETLINNNNTPFTYPYSTLLDNYNFDEPIELNKLNSDDIDGSLFPNNTYNEPFAFACDSNDGKNGPPIFVVHEAAFSNETGDYVYPLDFTQTLRIFLDLTSYATQRYLNI